jgi:predicted membrane channel-forming protein YqfA (hemolysin III family)
MGWVCVCVWAATVNTTSPPTSHTGTWHHSKCVLLRVIVYVCGVGVYGLGMCMCMSV